MYFKATKAQLFHQFPFKSTATKYFRVKLTKIKEKLFSAIPRLGEFNIPTVHLYLNNFRFQKVTCFKNAGGYRSVIPGILRYFNTKKVNNVINLVRELGVQRYKTFSPSVQCICLHGKLFLL